MCQSLFGRLGWGGLEIYLLDLGVGSTADHVYNIVFPAVRPQNMAILKVNFTFSLQKTVQNRVSISGKYLNFLATPFNHVFVMILELLKRFFRGVEDLRF